MRCWKEESDGGGPISTTSSMLPMSMPSSRVDVLTQIGDAGFGKALLHLQTQGRVQVGVMGEKALSKGRLPRKKAAVCSTSLRLLQRRETCARPPPPAHG